MKKVEIIECNNGFIVKWINQGLSLLKEPYQGAKPVYVFNREEDLVDHLQRAWDSTGEIEE